MYLLLGNLKLLHRHHMITSQAYFLTTHFSASFHIIMKHRLVGIIMRVRACVRVCPSTLTPPILTFELTLTGSLTASFPSDLIK